MRERMREGMRLLGLLGIVAAGAIMGGMLGFAGTGAVVGVIFGISVLCND